MNINGANTYLPGSPVIPNTLNVTNITNAIFAQVTVSTPNSFIAGQKIYFSIPFDYGMFQANGQTAKILAVDSTNLIFTTDLNTTEYNAFTVPSSGEMPAMVAPQGSSNIYNFTVLPFHAVNGSVGN